MIAYTLYPGEGFPMDIEFNVDISTWNFTASLIDRVTGDLLHSLNTTKLDEYMLRVHISNTATTDLSGKSVIVKVTGVDPSYPDEPVIEQALLIISRV